MLDMFSNSGGLVLQTRVKWWSLPADVHFLFFCGPGVFVKILSATVPTFFDRLC